MKKMQDDVDLLQDMLQSIPTFWDGKQSILTLKEHNYQWRQMEWIGFYFEWLCKDMLANAMATSLLMRIALSIGT